MSDNPFTSYTLEELLAMDFYTFFSDGSKLHDYYQALEDSFTPDSDPKRRRLARARMSEIRIHTWRRDRAVRAAVRIAESPRGVRRRRGQMAENDYSSLPPERLLKVRWKKLEADELWEFLIALVETAFDRRYTKAVNHLLLEIKNHFQIKFLVSLFQKYKALDLGGNGRREEGLQKLLQIWPWLGVED